MGAGRRWLAAVGLVLAVPFLAAAGDDMVVVTREYLNQLQDGQKRLREMEQNIPDARISRPEAKIYRPPPAAAGAAPALPAETRLLMEQKTVDSNLDSWERQGKLRDANKFIESADCDACGKPPPATSDGCLSCAADLPPPAPSERWEEVTEAEKRVYARGGRRRGRPAYPEEEPALLINDIVLRGDDADEFRFALRDVADARGRKLGARGIKMVLARVQSRIISAGYVTTRVYAEKQDLSGGTLVLTLKPGYLHEARLSEGSDTRISLYSNLPVRDGGLLNIRDIEQGLENFRRIPSAATTMELEPGTREGESDLVVNRDQHRRFRFRASADNAGQKATGRYQGAADLQHRQPAGHERPVLRHNESRPGVRPGAERQRLRLLLLDPPGLQLLLGQLRPLQVQPGGGGVVEQPALRGRDESRQAGLPAGGPPGFL
jgi:hypothetical protein